MDSRKKIGILGSGEVGQALAKGFILDGYEVMVGSRDGHRAALVDEALDMDVATGTFGEVAAWSELAVLAVKGSSAEGVAEEHARALAGKIVIDVTNPVSDEEPEHGVIRYFTTLHESLAERIQRVAPEARVVKAWNTVSHRFMIDPPFDRPTMPIAGNDTGARAEVSDILRGFGWDVEDMGLLVAARAIEPLAMLIAIPGFLRNEWNVAFKLLRTS